MSVYDIFLDNYFPKDYTILKCQLLTLYKIKTETVKRKLYNTISSVKSALKESRQVIK